MNICQAPSTIATPKTAKASQKCARIRRRLFNTAQPRLALRHIQKLGPVDHLDFGPHALVADAAKLLTRHEMVSRLVETRRDGGDVSRDEHRIDGGALDQKTVNDVRARRAQGDRRISGHDHALRRKRILLTDSAYGHRAVRLNRAAEVGLHEFAAEMQPGRTYC